MIDRIPTKSLRFGFDLTPEMGRALAEALEGYDSWKDEPVETIELATREELGLVHTLNYNINQDSPVPSGIFREYSRADGFWTSGFVNPDSPQYVAVEAEMRKAGQIRESDFPHESMIDGSLISEVKHWAVPYVLEIWDRNVPFHSFLATVASCEPEVNLSIHDFEPNEAKNLDRVLRGFTSPRIRSDEQEEMMVVIHLIMDRPISAKEIMEFFSHR